MKDYIDLILSAPSSQIDNSIKEYFQNITGQLKAINVLEILDRCVYNSLASDFAMYVFHAMLFELLDNEGLTYSQLEKQAFWRNK